MYYIQFNFQGIIDILIRGHDDEVKSGSTPEAGHFVTHSQDKWIHVWDSANHNVIWSYKSHVKNDLLFIIFFF